ncbi:hypothetical protein [Nocardia sp. NPDC048505]|uniref:hypothetical protein n=1 Tax=unclassified Nocardia TaxID=2637762 RepID=UPI0033FC1FFC
MSFSSHQQIRIRIAWSLFAVAVAVYGVDLGSQPWWHLSSCEKINVDAACKASLLSHYGFRFVLVTAFAVLACLAPMLRPTRSTAWITAAAATSLVILVAVVFSEPLWFDFVPIALIAIVLALFHRVLEAASLRAQNDSH